MPIRRTDTERDGMFAVVAMHENRVNDCRADFGLRLHAATHPQDIAVEAIGRVDAVFANDHVAEASGARAEFPMHSTPGHRGLASLVRTCRSTCRCLHCLLESACSRSKRRFRNECLAASLALGY